MVQKIMLGKYNKKTQGITLIESLVATIIIGIGFIAVFQMVQYSVNSIGVSADRSKNSYLINNCMFLFQKLYFLQLVVLNYHDFYEKN